MTVHSPSLGAVLPGGKHRPKGIYLLVISVYLLVALVAIGSIRYSINKIEMDISNIALERGTVLFRLIELTRDWNASLGGIYVPVTDVNQPNPYLKHSLRDITDNHGRALTMINPAFMTRQIAEIALKKDGVRFHITSLNPIRPANEADAWEKETLTLFEQSEMKERLAFFADGGGVMTEPVHRYMAPLIVKPPCMKCHESQGYKVDDIRGGISVSMPAGRLVSIAEQRRKEMMALYLIGFIIVAGLGHMVVWRTRLHLAALEEINRHQEEKLDEQSHELSAAEKEQQIATAVFNGAVEAVMVTDRDNRILRVNPAFIAITGYTPAEVIGLDPRLLASGRHDAEFFKEMWRHLDELDRWEGEIWNKRKNGEVFPAWLAITSVEGAAGEGRHVATFTDITKRKEAEQIILHRANYDQLTQLPNRSLFDDRLVSVIAMARRHRRSFALMYIDLDYFKAVNDRLGHAAGDTVLAEAAQRIEKCVRESDTAARLGGDEFAVLISDLNERHEVDEVAQRINVALAKPFLLAEGEATISGSIGIAIFPEHGQNELILKKLADTALYAAKAAGRNTYCIAPLQD